MTDPNAFALLNISGADNPNLADWYYHCAALCAVNNVDGGGGDEELASLGFAPAGHFGALSPYSLSQYTESCHGDIRSHGWFDRKGLATQAYPVLAGSAAYLGVEHPASDDLDFTAYVEVSFGTEPQKDLLHELDRLIEECGAKEVYLKASTKSRRRSGQTAQPPDGNEPQASTQTIEFTGRTLEDSLLTGPRGKSSQLSFCNVNTIRLEGVEMIGGRQQDISLVFQLDHSNKHNLDCFPFQEFHFCADQAFLHKDKPWVVENYSHHVNFLFDDMTRYAQSNVLKAAKRGFVLAGVLGIVDIQRELHRLISSISEPALSSRDGEELGDLIDQLAREVATTLQAVRQQKMEEA